MDQSKINTFLSVNSTKFSKAQLYEITQILKNEPEEAVFAYTSLPYKDPQTLLILSVLAGCWGVDRFLLNDILCGVLKFITAGGCGIWWLIDCILIQDMTKEYNYKLFMDSYMIMSQTSRY